MEKNEHEFEVIICTWCTWIFFYFLFLHCREISWDVKYRKIICLVYGIVVGIFGGTFEPTIEGHRSPSFQIETIFGWWWWFYKNYARILQRIQRYYFLVKIIIIKNIYNQRIFWYSFTLDHLSYFIFHINYFIKK